MLRFDGPSPAVRQDVLNAIASGAKAAVLAHLASNGMPTGEVTL